MARSSIKPDGWAVPLDPALVTPTPDLYHAFMEDDDSVVVVGSAMVNRPSEGEVVASAGSDVTACGLRFNGRAGLMTRREVISDEHARLCPACLVALGERPARGGQHRRRSHA